MTDEAALFQNPDPSSIYAVFVGAIDQQSARRLVDGLATATGRGPIQRVHLAFQSAGGTVGDGVFVYNWFRTLPSELVIYNMGSVLSIGTIAFIGAKKRKACASASFMLHRSTYSMDKPTTASRAHLIAHSLGLDDQRTETILRENVTLSAEQWAVHERDDLWFNAQDAKAAGIIDEIGDFAPPMGQKVFTI